jgi:hypothetical protein
MKPMFFGLDGVLKGIVPVPSKGFEMSANKGGCYPGRVPRVTDKRDSIKRRIGSCAGAAGEY